MGIGVVRQGGDHRREGRALILLAPLPVEQGGQRSQRQILQEAPVVAVGQLLVAQGVAGALAQGVRGLLILHHAAAQQRGWCHVLQQRNAVVIALDGALLANTCSSRPARSRVMASASCSS